MDKRSLFRLFLQPKEKDKDLARQEFILNVLLLGCIALAATSSILVTRNYFRSGKEFDGAPPYVVIFGFLIFSYLYYASRLGYSKFATYSFIVMLLFPGFYVSFAWGSLLPQAVLMYALVIIIAGILLSSKVAFAFTLIISIFLIIVSYLQSNKLITYDNAWQEHIYSLNDAIPASATLGVIALVSWLFNREIEKALQRARRSEKALKKERDFLEVRVEERTKELKKAQLEKVLHLYRLADFGRMAAGFFHDLVTPLTTVSLNLEQLQARSKRMKSWNADVEPLLKRAASGTQRMKSFVQAVRKQIQKQEEKVVFNLNREIIQSLDVLNYKAKSIRVKLHFVYPKTIHTYGNPLRFNQLMTNLVSNAIEAYEKTRRRKNRQVIIKLETKNAKKAVLVVQDFGCGIAKKNLKKIFNPFFTTKSIDKGTGMGLSICKSIVEKGFDGKIKVESKEGKGTTVIAEFPIRKI